MEKIDFLDKKKIVIKFGTASIVQYDCISDEKLKKRADDILYLKSMEKDITIVSSGAQAKGRQIIQHYSNTEDDDSKKRALMALGQAGLFHSWENYFLGRHKLGMILATKRMFEDKDEFSSLSGVYNSLLEQKHIPFLNGNYAISPKSGFKDNDELAAYTATGFNNDLLLILTTKDGLLKDGRTVEELKTFDRGFYDFIKDSEFGRGGIESKLDAAKMCNEKGIPCIISNAEHKLYDILKGDAPRTVSVIYPKDLFSGTKEN